MANLILTINKEERYSRVARLSDTRYSAKRDQGEMEICKQKSEMKCATYPRSQYMVMWAVGRFGRYTR